MVDLGMKILFNSPFEGKDLESIWNNEELEWSKHLTNMKMSFRNLINSTELEKPLIAPSSDISQRPIICQDIYWSTDGQLLTAVTDDHGIRQYVIANNDSERTLKLPLAQRFFKNQSIVSSDISLIYSFENNFNNNDMNTILIGSRNLPIQLYSLNLENEQDKRAPIFAYNTVNNQTEKYEVPYMIRYINKREFITGSTRNSVSLYDLERKDPVWKIRSDKIRCGKAVYKAIVSCFDELASPNALYECDSFSTNNRYFGTYKNEIYHFDTRARSPSMKLMHGNNNCGNGIYQILKSENGNYVYVLKRRSDLITIHDTRNFFSKVGELKLPFTIKNQKFKASISTYDGLSIGTPQGTIINWERGLIEFGGIPRDTNEQTEPNSICPTTIHRYHPVSDKENPAIYTAPRINIIKPNPNNPEQLAISYSPDKFNCDSNNNKSGISIIKTT